MRIPIIKCASFNLQNWKKLLKFNFHFLNFSGQPIDIEIREILVITFLLPVGWSDFIHVCKTKYKHAIFSCIFYWSDRNILNNEYVFVFFKLKINTCCLFITCPKVAKIIHVCKTWKVTHFVLVLFLNWSDSVLKRFLI